jgi:heterodisulfide reductase subunit A-like polyferredoxin
MYEKRGRYIVEFQDIPKERQHQREIPIEERRGSYKEVELGFDEDGALQEAKRCLSCRRCLGCALCWAECKPEAINFEMEDEYVELEADAVMISPGLERPLDRVDGRFGLGRNLNVITDLQLERMLDDAGPSAGLVIRPYDGEIPTTIAFVQGYENAAANMHKAALCLGINEAVLVRRKVPEAQISVFATELDEFRTQYEASLSGLDGIEITEASVNAVEPEDTQSLKLTVSGNGTEESRVFDLVVLLTQPQVSREVKKLGKNLGLSLGYANFVAEEDAVLLGTDKETVQLISQV